MPATTSDVQSWIDRLPADLTYGTFAEDFRIDGSHYTHGAWNAGGEWWLAWNTEDEFAQQLASLAETAPDE